MNEDCADTTASQRDFFRGIVGAVINIHGPGDASFEDGILKTVDKIDCVIIRIKLAMWDDSGGVIDKANKVCSSRFAFDFNVWADEGVALPEIIGVRFGKCLTTFVGDLRFGFE